MAKGSAAAAAPGIVLAGVVCLGVVLLAIIATVVLSLISTFTPNQSSQGYGSVYAFDAIMLKFLYYNQTSAQFVNGTVTYSEDLSRLCTEEYENLGTKNFAACVLYQGVVYAPYNESSNSRRRRATTSGMYYISQGRVFFSTNCPREADKNKTDNATSLSYCVQKELAACNLIINRGQSAFQEWTVTSPVTLQAVNVSGNQSFAQVNRIWGVPSTTAVAIGNTLPLQNGTIASLQVGCRYIGQISIASLISTVSALSTNSSTNSTG